MTRLDALLDAAAGKLTGPNAAALVLLLASSLVASAAMFLHSHQGLHTPGRWLRYAFPRDVLAHPSARADFLFWTTRKLLMPLLMLPTSAAAVVAVGYGMHEVLSAALGASSHRAQGAAGPMTIVLFTLTALLAYDISYYLYHRAQHRFPALWELHKVHHSAEVMVGITKDRIHPIDEIMNRAWDGLVVGSLYGVWLFFAVDPVEATVFGINVYVLRNILMMDLLRHTHLKVSFGPLNHLVLCPHWHQLHHSNDPKHFDRNFGLMLSVWDRLFGTLAVPKRGETFEFGIGPRESSNYQTLYGLYVLPLLRMGAALLPWRRRTAAASAGAGEAAPRDGGLRVEVVCDQAGLDVLAPAWRNLEARAGTALFRSHAWIDAWWRVGGASRGFRLRVVAAWEGAELVGVLPLAVRRYRGLRALEWAGKDCSDYCDALLAPTSAQDLSRPGRAGTLATLWREAVREGGFDVAYLSHLRTGAAAARLARLGREEVGLGMAPSHRRATAATLHLGDHPDGAVFFHSLGRNGRKNHLRGMRRLEQVAGPVRFRLTAPDEAGAVLRRLREMKLGWLRRNGRSSPVLEDDGSLLHALAGVMAARGDMRLFALEAGDRLAAGLLCFAEGGCLSAYLISYDAELGRASPGSIVLVEAIRWAAANGFSKVDFLCGDEDFKSRLANASEELSSLAGARTLAGHLALTFDASLGALLRTWLGWRRKGPAFGGSTGSLSPSGWDAPRSAMTATRTEPS